MTNTTHQIYLKVKPSDEFFIFDNEDKPVIYLVTTNHPTTKIFNDLALNEAQINRLFDRLKEAQTVAIRENKPMEVYFNLN
jgi:hypothetical protein